MERIGNYDEILKEMMEVSEHDDDELENDDREIMDASTMISIALFNT